MSTFVAEINKLRNIQQHLEKSESVHLEQISKIDEGSYDLHKELSSSRAAEIEKLHGDVINVIVPLRKVNELIQHENLVNIDLKNVKKDMRAIQGNIQNLKTSNKTQLEFLQKEEEKLVEDIKAFEQKMEEWNKPSTGNLLKKIVAKKTSASTPENISQEVKDFMEFVVATGGHENGWATDDHNLFLRVRAKTKNVVKLAEMIHTMLPDISEEEIFAHEKWYQKYLDLKEKQKNSIKTWRIDKLNSKPAVSISSEKILVKPYSDYLSKEKLQKKITAWRVEKRAQTINEREQHQHLKLKQKQLERQQKQKHKQMRVEVTNWRQVKKTEEEAEKIKKEELELRDRENRASRANKLIKQFQSQDEVFIQRKLQLKQVRPKSAEQEVVKNKVEVPRDPERLLRPTKQWILRTYGGDSSGSSKQYSVQAIPKLRVPEWRRSIF